MNPQPKSVFENLTLANLNSITNASCEYGIAQCFSFIARSLEAAIECLNRKKNKDAKMHCEAAKMKTKQLLDRIQILQETKELYDEGGKFKDFVEDANKIVDQMLDNFIQPARYVTNPDDLFKSKEESEFGLKHSLTVKYSFDEESDENKENRELYKKAFNYALMLKLNSGDATGVENYSIFMNTGEVGSVGGKYQQGSIDNIVTKLNHTLGIIETTLVEIEKKGAVNDGEKEEGSDENALQKEFESKIVDVTNPNDEKWTKDIIGMKNTKDLMESVIVTPFKMPKIAKIVAYTGVLLYGPPGTGKTFLIEGLAHHIADYARIFATSGSDFASKYQGESEKKVKALFDLARKKQKETQIGSDGKSKIKKSIIFIDELDAIASQRQEGENATARAVKNELLVQMEGVGKERIFVIGSTNTPMQIDSGVLRRFQKRIEITLPEVGEVYQMITRAFEREGWVEQFKQNLSVPAPSYEELLANCALLLYYAGTSYDVVLQIYGKRNEKPSLSKKLREMTDEDWDNQAQNFTIINEKLKPFKLISSSDVKSFVLDVSNAIVKKITQAKCWVVVGQKNNKPVYGVGENDAKGGCSGGDLPKDDDSYEIQLPLPTPKEIYDLAFNRKGSAKVKDLHDIKKFTDQFGEKSETYSDTITLSEDVLFSTF